MREKCGLVFMKNWLKISLPVYDLRGWLNDGVKNQLSVYVKRRLPSGPCGYWLRWLCAKAGGRHMGSSYKPSSCCLWSAVLVSSKDSNRSHYVSTDLLARVVHPALCNTVWLKDFVVVVADILTLFLFFLLFIHFLFTLTLYHYLVPACKCSLFWVDFDLTWNLRKERQKKRGKNIPSVTGN